MDRRDVVDRSVDFGHDYPMRCPHCDHITTVTAQDVYEQINECHVPCSGCGKDLHFGPAVQAIRDPHDPALDAAVVPTLAWYHTSTEQCWPSATRAPMPLGPAARSIPCDARDRMLDRYATQALHVGTYEAAIESMLRRMRDQDDATSAFYLYRVRLRSDVQIEPGYRDENHQEAAQVTQPQIRGWGWSAIRYLNVHEAQGSLSLALCRDAIEAVQSLPIPIAGLDAGVVPELDSEVAELAGKVEALCDEAPQEPDLPTRLTARAGHRPPPYTHAQYELRAQMIDRLAGVLLPDVSPVLRDQVASSMRVWYDATPDCTIQILVERFSAVTALFTRSEVVLRLLAAVPARRVT